MVMQMAMRNEPGLQELLPGRISTETAANDDERTPFYQPICGAHMLSLIYFPDRLLVCW